MVQIYHPAGSGVAGSNKYGIRSIPSNVLINGKGIIIARDLKGASLHEFLESQKK